VGYRGAVPYLTAGRGCASAWRCAGLGTGPLLEVDVSHYRTSVYGLLASIVYAKGASALAQRSGSGRDWVGRAGADLMTNTALVKFKHDLDN
jgi:hypothetical protein